MTKRRKVYQLIGNLYLDSGYGGKPIGELLDSIKKRIDECGATHYEAEYISGYDGNDYGYSISLLKEREETDEEYNSRVEQEKEFDFRVKQQEENAAAAEIRLMHQLKQKYPNQW